MVQINQEVTVYQLRVALLRTSPHVWRRLLIPSHATLADLHRTIVCAFGLEDGHLCCFRIRGRSFATSPNDGDMSGSGPHLSEFQFFLRERFVYDFHCHEAQPPAWRLEIRLEKVVPAEQGDLFPRCIAGRGSPPLDQVSSPRELADFADLFTPRYMVHRLAEMIDNGVDDRRIARELRYLRPWLQLKQFQAKEVNRRLARQMGGQS